MAHYTTTIETTASAETSFAYLADFSNTEAWDPTVSRARKLTPDPIGEGALFELFLTLAGRDLRFEYRITRHVPDRLVVLEAETALLRSLDTIEIESRPSGCRVHYDADLRLRGATHLLDLPVHLAFQISGSRSAQGLERALDKLS
jgi:hypothetical protein